MRKHTLLLAVLFIVASFSARAQLIWSWARQADSSNFQTPTSTAFDNNDNIYYTGYCSGTRMAFGNIGLDITGNQDDFLAKYDVSGNILWARNATAFRSVVSNYVATDPNNNVLETGFFSDSVIFGTNHFSAYGQFNDNAYLVKYSPSGNLLWAIAPTFSPGAFCQGMGVAADKGSNVYQTGSFQGSVNFGGTTLTTSGGAPYLAKYNSAGNLLWAVAPVSGTSSFASSYAVAVDDSDNVIFDGNFSGSLTFGTTTLNAAGGFENMFLAKYDSNGNFRWAIDVPANWGSGAPAPLAVDRSGNSYVSEEFSQASLTIGTSTITNGNPPDGNAMLAKYDRNGNPVWALSAAFVSSAEVAAIGASSIATDRCKNVYWSGVCLDTLRVGSVGVAPPNSNSSQDFTYVIMLDSNGSPINGVGIANDASNYFTNGLAVDAHLKVSLCSELSASSLPLGNDTIKRYLFAPTAFDTKFALEPIVQINNKRDDTICIGDNDTLRVSAAPGISFMWNTGATTDSIIVNPPVTTTYYVVFYTCFPDTDFVTVVVQGDMQKNLNLRYDSVCQYVPVTLTAQPIGGPITYLWSTGATTSSITVNDSASGMYIVTGGCHHVKDTANITVTPAPKVHFNSDTNQGCAPLCIQFTDHSTDSLGTVTKWKWSFGNGDTSNLQNPTYCYNNSGRYSPELTATSRSGCSSMLQIPDMITAYSKPAVNFTYTPDPAIALLDTIRIQFQDASIDSNGITSWKWSFGDSTTYTSTLQSPGHTYDTGTYCPELVVTNVKNCVDSLTKCFYVAPSFTLYIPSAFTPNGDHKNPIFLPQGCFINSFEMYIFDRWGTQLFYSNDPNIGWDGTTGPNKMPCSKDTYVYLVKVIDGKNLKHTFTGAVTLLR